MLENALSKQPKPIGQILENIGYSKGVTETPKMVLETAGFKQALRELGLTEELITTALVNDINEKPKNRLGELRLGAELLGINKPEIEPEKPRSGNTYNFIFNEATQSKIKAIDATIKEQLLNGNNKED